MDLFGNEQEVNQRELRYYQSEATLAVMDAWSKGEIPLLTMATGTGKTIVMAELARIIHAGNGKTLIGAHREELVRQAQDKIGSHVGYTPAIEMAGEWADSRARIVIGSIQTMQRQRLGRWKPDYFSHFFIDEAHHAVCTSYKNMIKHFESAKLLGVTATADRSDDKQLGNIFTKVAYDYPLHKAIKDGYLVPIKGRRCKDFSIDLSGLKITAGDFSDEELGEAIEKYIDPIAKNVIEQTAGMSTLCFCPNVDSSRLLAESLQRQGIEAGYISGNTDKELRRDTLYRFHTGIITHLCSCNVLLEGYDEPRTQAIVMLRPTGSRTVYAQAIGRGTRLHAGKDSLLLVEFTYNSSKLKLVTAYELFSTMGYGERVQEHAIKLAEKDGGDEDFLELVEKAHKEQYDKRLAIERMILPKWGFVEFDPLELGTVFGVDISGEFDISYKGFKLTGPATEKQRDLLQRYGVSNLDKLDKAQASVLISSFMDRGIYPTPGFATISQQELLVKLGFVGQVDTIKKAQASFLIDELRRAKDAMVN
jgi:superfamily II DNA or RNA helicase